MGRFFRWIWHGRGGRTPWVRRILAVLFFFLLPAPVILLLFFRFVPIPGTPQMLLDTVTLQPVKYSWRAYDEIAPALPRAVIGAEDQNFCSHRGFDWKGIDKAMAEHKRHPNKPLRGASTISQQTARTLFLVPARSWIRKGVEAYLTVMIEALWPKKRILTAYLNLVDWGHGNYGAEAASEVVFRHQCRQAHPIAGRAACGHFAESGPLARGPSGALRCRPLETPARTGIRRRRRWARLVREIAEVT